MVFYEYTMAPASKTVIPKKRFYPLMGSWVYQLQMRDLPEGSNTNTLMQQELEKLGNEKCRENEKKKDNFFL